MIENSRNPKRLSINAGAGSLVSRWRSIFTSLVVVLMIGNTGQISTVQAAPADITELRFFMIANKKGASKPVCIGERVPIQVLVYRLKLVDGVSQAPEVVTGASVNGVVENPNIGQISPTQNTTQWAGSSIYPGAADFVFTAENAGETIIRFAGIVATPGWFGTNWKGGAKSFTAEVAVRVIPCKFKVEAIAEWYEASDGAYYSIAAASDEAVVTADADNHYTGSANVHWVGSGQTADPCGFPVQIASGQVQYTGELDESGQLVINQTYEPVENSWTYACGNVSGSGKGLFTSDSISVSMPASGGASTLPHVLNVVWWIPMSGSVTIVVTPMEDKAVAFTPGNHKHQASWDGFLSLFGVLFSFR